MSRKRNRSMSRGRKKQFTLPLAVIAGFIPLGDHIYSRWKAGQGVGSFTKGLQTGMGYNPDTKVWAIGNAKLGIIPIAAGMIVHKVAGKLGFNRMLAQAGIPIIRI